MLSKRGLSRYAVSVVCLSVTFVYSVKTNKHIFKIVSPSGSQAILVFPYQTAWQYSDGNPPNGGIECRLGRQKSRFWASLDAVNAVTGHGLSIRRRWTMVPQVVTLIAGSKQQSLLTAGDDDEIFMTRSLNVTPKTTEQYLIARSDKSVAYVTNYKRLCWTFCTTEAKR